MAKNTDSKQSDSQQNTSWRGRFWVTLILFVLYVAGSITLAVYWRNNTVQSLDKTLALAKAQHEMQSQLEQQNQNLSVEKATAEDLTRIMELTNNQMQHLKEENKHLRDTLTFLSQNYNYVAEAVNNRGRFVGIKAAVQIIAKDSVQRSVRCSVPLAAKLFEVGKVGYVALNARTQMKREEVSAITPLNGFMVTLSGLQDVNLLVVRYYRKGNNELLHEQYYPLN